MAISSLLLSRLNRTTLVSDGAGNWHAAPSGGGGSGSQSPWTGTIDAANHPLVNAGAVGIGTSSPQKMLHVAGTAQIDGPTLIKELVPQGDISMGTFTSRP